MAQFFRKALTPRSAPKNKATENHSVVVVPEEEQAAFLEKLVKQAKIPQIDYIDDKAIDQNLLNLISEEIAFQLSVIPMERNDNVLDLAMANPFDLEARDVVKRKTGCDVNPFFYPAKGINDCLERLYSHKGSIEQSLQEIVDFEVEDDLQEDESDVEMLRIQANDAPAIRFVNLTLLQAIRDGASDIHIEPQENTICVRYRIDGMLREIVPPPPKKMQNGIISRIKILGDLDIAERRVPQDGRCKIKMLGRSVDIRISTLPTIYGEKVVLRLLDQSGNFLNIDDLGFSEQMRDNFKRILEMPNGMVLVTGPTGSGKTTTLYSALKYISRPHLNIITVEDPVEYRLHGINQVQVKPQIGLTFASGLRSILRQDPDIVMVGEIRDLETAEIAIRASLTGHLVLSTLHTNDAVASIMRLVDMGIDKFLLTASIRMVLSQRLVRKICPQCKIEYTPSNEVMARYHRLNADLDETIRFYRGTGCRLCGNTGYKRRIAIYEFVFLTDQLKTLISKDVEENELRKEVRRMGMKSLVENGLEKVSEGVTTLEEVFRVAFTSFSDIF
ncbi:MAG: GspE/PulE family protein [Candidatus Zhuqueibacterota bacterium]